MSDLSPELARKFHGDELRRLAETQSDRIVSVILELALPRRTVDVGFDATSGRPSFGWANAQADLDVVGLSTRIADTIRNMTGRPVVELRSSRALSTQLSGSQLLEIAALDEIGAIHPNPRHVVSSGPTIE